MFPCTPITEQQYLYRSCNFRNYDRKNDRPRPSLFLVDESTETCSVQRGNGRAHAEVFCELLEFFSSNIGCAYFELTDCLELSITVCDDPNPKNIFHAFLRLGSGNDQLTKAKKLSNLARFQKY